jgi:hypothetical protein
LGLCLEDACVVEGTLLFCARFPALCATAAEAAGGAAMAGICVLTGYCSEADDSSSDAGGQCPTPKTHRDKFDKLRGAVIKGIDQKMLRTRDGR